MRIAVITPLFALSGVALAQLRFSRALAARGDEVDLVIGRVGTEYKLPPLPEVNVRDLDRRHVRDMIGPLSRYFRERRPEVVFSAEDHLNAMVLSVAISTRSRAKISCSSRVTPFDTYSKEPFSKRWTLKQLMRAVMWRADALTCVSRDMVEQYRQVFDGAPHVCAYNIVADARSRDRMQEPLEHAWFQRGPEPLLIAAGRLAPWKGFDDLIRAASVLATRRRFRLLILGDGPQRQDLQALIDQYGLSEHVQLEGYVENPLKYFVRANVFVLSSLLEGLPNVLVESMMCGCTPVSTDCPTGPSEVLQGGRYGYLVPMRNPVAIANAIEQALDAPIPDERLAAAIRSFEESAVIERHFDLLGLPSLEGRRA